MTSPPEPTHRAAGSDGVDTEVPGASPHRDGVERAPIGDAKPVEASSSPKPHRIENKLARSVVEWSLVLAAALLVVLLLRTFLVQSFYIPSPSMEPTLKKNDRVLVNKLSYKLHAVHRGDVVVFSKPDCQQTPAWASCGATSADKDLIKRVIGLPGDTLSLRNGHVLVDGHRLKEPYTHGTQTYKICAFPSTYTIPAKQVFVMGDSRQNSTDSRCFGPIPDSKIVGRAFVRIWPPGRLGTL